MRRKVTLTEGQLRQIVEDASRMVIQEMVDEGFFGDLGDAFGAAWNKLKNSGTGQSVINGINTFKDANKNTLNNLTRAAGRVAGNMAKNPLQFNPNVAAYNYIAKPAGQAAYNYSNPLITAGKKAANRALNSVGNAARAGYNAVRNSSPVRNFQNGFNQGYQG